MRAAGGAASTVNARAATTFRPSAARTMNSRLQLNPIYL
jgi:hypothetical protein